MLASSASGERFPAAPGAKAFCPTCQSEVIAKCGEVKVWHWAHKSLKDCDVWSEPESEWHYGWKTLAGMENTEIVISNQFGEVHRADIKINGRVIELQHSALSTKEVRDRENFYGKMIWVIDGESIGDFDFSKWRSEKGREYYVIRKIKRSWIQSTTKPVFFHFRCLYVSHINHWVKTGYAWPEYDMESEAIESELYQDVLVMWSKKKFATIISKEEFCDKIFGEFHDN